MTMVPLATPMKSDTRGQRTAALDEYRSRTRVLFVSAGTSPSQSSVPSGYWDPREFAALPSLSDSVGDEGVALDVTILAAGTNREADPPAEQGIRSCGP